MAATGRCVRITSSELWPSGGDQSRQLHANHGTQQGVQGLQEGLGMLLGSSLSMRMRSLTYLSPLDRKEEERKEGDVFILVDSYTLSWMLLFPGVSESRGFRS